MVLIVSLSPALLDVVYLTARVVVVFMFTHLFVICSFARILRTIHEYQMNSVYLKLVGDFQSAIARSVERSWMVFWFLDSMHS